MRPHIGERPHHARDREGAADADRQVESRGDESRRAAAGDDGECDGDNREAKSRAIPWNGLPLRCVIGWVRDPSRSARVTREATGGEHTDRDRGRGHMKRRRDRDPRRRARHDPA